MSRDEGEKKYKKYCFDYNGLLVGEYPSDQNIISVKGSEMKLEGNFGHLGLKRQCTKRRFHRQCPQQGCLRVLCEPHRREIPIG